MTKDEIAKIVKNADKNIYSHVVFYSDSWDYSFYANYVTHDEDIKKYIEVKPNSMTKVMEVYNLSLDIDAQLNERRSYHIEKVKKENQTLIDKAQKFAEEKHKNQYRKSTNEKILYITHPINVANFIKSYYKGNNLNDLICAGILHDTLEDTNTSFEELVENFGYHIAYLVKELTNNDNMKHELGKSEYLSYKLVELSDDALIIKLCDRLDNVLSLANADETFKEKYLQETITILDYLQVYRKLNDIEALILNDIYIAINNYNKPKRLALV